MINDKSLAFLETYLNNASPTGFEWKGQQIWLDYIKPYIDEQIVDTYGTAVGVINPGQPYKVVIEAHADEISWFFDGMLASGSVWAINAIIEWFELNRPKQD